MLKPTSEDILTLCTQIKMPSKKRPLKEQTCPLNYGFKPRLKHFKKLRVSGGPFTTESYAPHRPISQVYSPELLTQIKRNIQQKTEVPCGR